MRAGFEETPDGIGYRARCGWGIRLLAAFFSLTSFFIAGLALRQAVRGPTWGDTAGLVLMALLPLAVGGVFVLFALHKDQHVHFSRVTRRVSGFLSPRWRLGAAMDRPFSEIRAIEARQIDFESGPSYALDMTMTDGKTFTLGFAETLADARQWRDRIAAMIA